MALAPCGPLLFFAGMLLIVMVMLLDHFVFAIKEPFILFCACVSAVLLIAGIRIVKKAEDREAQQNAVLLAENKTAKG